MAFNRFVTFVKPYLDALAGAIAALLVAKLNVLGLPGLDQSNTATWIAGALAWLVTHGGLALGNLSWIKGHHIELEHGIDAVFGNPASDVAETPGTATDATSTV